MRRRFLQLVGAIILFASNSIADAVADWNKIANDVFLSSGRPGGAIIVDMAYVHISIYDAVNAIDGRHIPYAVTPSNSVPWASKDAATAAAARRVLLTFYASQQPYIDSVYGAAIALLPNDSTRARGIAIGDTVATRFLALRANDGRNAIVPYTFGSGPGVYQLTPGAPPPPATPQTPWLAQLKPFAMLSPSQFRAPGPPALTSDVYTTDFNEVKRYGAHDSSARTAEQTAIGQFYGENPGGQLSRNIRNLASARGLSIAENARLFAQLYVTIADAVIAGWDSKFHYNFWRPVTAIRAADTDGNPQTLQDTSWLPLLVTPGHPEYPAAHGCVTGGLAYAIERFFDTDQQNVTLTSTSVAGAAMTEHHFTNTQDIVSEVINARVYGGIHYRTSAEHGAMIARKVADWVADHYFKIKNTDIPTAGLQLWLRADAGVTLNGTTVSGWADQSGNGNDAIQANASRQPLLVAGALNGRPVLRFDGANDRLGLTGATPMSQISLFIVQKADAGATGPYPYYPISLGDAFHDGQVYYLSMQNDFSIARSDEIEPGAGLHQWVRATVKDCAAFGQWKIVSVVTDQRIWSTTLRANGVNASIAPQESNISISVPLGDSTGTGVGGIGGADGVPVGQLTFKGDIAEVLVYSSALTDSARQAVENYLNSKYHVLTPSVAGLQLWLKADAGVDTLNGTVSRWHDQSGNGNDALQPDTARQPFLLGNAVNGKPALRFDGVNDRLGFTGTTRMSQFSIFIVQKIDSGAADAHYYYPITLGDNTGDYGLSMRNGFSNNSPDEIDPYVGENSWVRAVTPGCAAFGQWKIVSVIANTSMWNTTMHVNGVSAAITSQGFENAALSVPLGNAASSDIGGGLGMTSGVPIGFLIARCHVAEVLVYGSAISDSARKSVEQYLMLKYLGLVTAVAGSGSGYLPERYVLSQNYPNPFNPTTVIRYQLPVDNSVKLVVYDVLGREVAVLVNEHKPAGSYSVQFNASGVASGVYLYRLTTGSFVQTRKMILVR